MLEDSASLPLGGLMVAVAVSTFVESREKVTELQWEVRRLQRNRSAALSSRPLPVALVRQQYREAMPDLVSSLRSRGAKHQRANNALQAVIIIGALWTSALAAFITGDASRWIAVASSLIVGTSAAFANFFKLRERAVSLAKAADLIEREIRALDLHIEHYADLTEEAALGEFAKRAEGVRREQLDQERDLNETAQTNFLPLTDNRSDPRQVGGQSNPS